MPANDSSGPFCKTIQQDQSLCQSCHWAEEGKNCWEVQVSPCCQNSRDQCQRCPVKIAYMQAHGCFCPVLLCTDQGEIIHGHVYVPADLRLSDMLGADRRRFIPVVRPRWLRGEPEYAGDWKVAMIGVEHIVWIAPEEEAAGASKLDAA